MRNALTFVLKDIVNLFNGGLGHKHPLLLIWGLIPVVPNVSLNEIAAVAHCIYTILFYSKIILIEFSYNAVSK